MAKERQTFQEIDDTLTRDDIDMLRAVLEDEHSRGMTPVSVYRQQDFDVE